MLKVNMLKKNKTEANILKTRVPRITILKYTKDKVYNIRYDTYCFTK